MNFVRLRHVVMRPYALPPAPTCPWFEFKPFASGLAICRDQAGSLPEVSHHSGTADSTRLSTRELIPADPTSSPSEAEAHAIRHSLGVVSVHISRLQAENPTPVVTSDLSELSAKIHDHLWITERRSSTTVAHATTVARATTVTHATPHIALVCHHWRSVALDTPVFGASLYASVTAGPMSLSLLQLFFRRSQDAPLSIKLGADADPINHAILDAIIQPSCRWRRLYLGVDIKGHLTEFLSAIPDGRLRHLETFSLEDSKGHSARRITDAPNLRALSIDYVWNMPQLPFHQRQKLYIRAWGGELCRQLLPTCPNICTLTIGHIP
ncbi:hypothetical protein DFH09DRAFT_1091898 [Mycena vulgaris]|nr:hypothetical protein DFH09DRAFT_1091898 [Mycena vulgaris]